MMDFKKTVLGYFEKGYAPASNLHDDNHDENAW